MRVRQSPCTMELTVKGRGRYCTRGYQRDGHWEIQSVLESHNQATLSSVGKREKVYISDIQIEKPRIEVECVLVS